MTRPHQAGNCEDAVRGFIMVSSFQPSVHNVLLAAQLATVEVAIAREFSRRLHGFQIEIRNDGVVLKGRTKTYFCKQVVQEAVVSALHLPIAENYISVEDFRQVATEFHVLDCDSEGDLRH